ncbi:phosphate acetyltransferase [Virgisporangium aurantiacum]|uniref:Phosphate acetyltransferase n=1 Tax=Virgisporangium aurantiacum TaxID=175570 RepID=A0A8J3Z453_9ACTN|nr:phosphate acetyltransferase [Virgisporangium aurantiacum]GIJ54668.1 phosphate acetyltransferase [Virgisporangium aurantiacum]
MARSIYIAENGAGAGKSAVALGIAELLSRRVPELGVFRPLVVDADRDDTIDLIRARYGVDIPRAELYGVTYAEAAAMVADGRREDLLAHIVDRYRAVDRRCGAVVVVGSDFDDGHHKAAGGLSRELAFNARLATEFGSVVVAVVNGAASEAAALPDQARSAYHSLTDLDATVAAVVINRAPPSPPSATNQLLSALRPPDLPVPSFVIPAVATLGAPTVAEVAAALGAEVVTGDSAALGRDVLGYVVGAAQVPQVLAHLTPGALIITPGDRNDLLVATAAAQVAGVTSAAGIVLTLGIEPDPVALKVFEGLGSGLAVLRVETGSFGTIAASTRIEHRLSAAYPRKVEAALGVFESYVDGGELSRVLDVSRSTRVTPMMFEYELLDRARADRRRVVLPEGTEERILRAADTLLRRGAADLTLLGDPDTVRRKARDLGLDLEAADVVDPVTSDLRDGFAEQYVELRRHKGMTSDLAHDVMRDVNYFGTMMVHNGHADGMVSGSVHTTAATIRPAFEIVKTRPGVSVASSVFLMLLPDRVLVYGDCAVNPDPDATQLADIALSSAETAAAFGIEPRVAMLSYSTGASGAGADVTKVAEATERVRKLRPDLPVDGPIQYDAAIDPAVASTKMPDSTVAGRATVFVFPDLNTGNNTYKAVQRSAGAVAVGPVLQGLRRPVNDLSRGATVKDIVNTVAITAVQAALSQ